MGLWNRLFGKREKTAPAQSTSGGGSPPADMVHFIDAYGRDVYLTKPEWQKVLIGNLQAARNNPEQLYNLIVGGLQDGFAAAVIPFAERLKAIDPMPARGATTLGVAYLQLQRLDDAERVLSGYLREHGPEGFVLTNLAKVYDARGDRTRADATLWKALELEPNQQNGLLWFASLAREKNGQAGWHEAMQRVAAMPSSWMAQLWLAQEVLDQGDKACALQLYEVAMGRCPRPVPADMLKQLTGDLGRHGHLVEALRMASPVFDARLHGLEVGNNLIKANLELGRLDHARAIVDQLYALKQPSYEQLLAFWDSEIAKARTAARDQTVPGPESFTLLRVHGPLWLNDTATSQHLVAEKSEDAVVIALIGATATMPGQTAPQRQMPDAPGRLSRTLPLYLCEQLHLLTDAVGEVLQPFLQGAGFMLAGMPWENEFIAHQARQAELPADYAVICHLEKIAGRDEISLRLLRTIDGTQLESTSIPLDYSQPAVAVKNSAAWLLNVASRQCQVEQTPSSWYTPPDGVSLNDYLLRLEQSLAVRLSQVDVAPDEFLSGEREILSGSIQLCLQCPTNVASRLLLVRTLESMNAVRPQVVLEFADRVGKLQKEHPLPSPFQQQADERLAVLFHQTPFQADNG